MAIVTVGIDLAKNVFAVHGVDETGKPALVRPEVPRAKLLELIANLPPCLIGMEACSGAHHWAREFAKFGHTVRMMAPKFVVPYRMSGKRGKNDAADAAAICEAVTRPNVRFVERMEPEHRLIWALAGLWSEWTDPATGEVMPKYTMLTQNCDGPPVLGLMHRPDKNQAADQQDKRSVVPMNMLIGMLGCTALASRLRA